MKQILSFFLALSVYSYGWSQCNVVGTAMPQPASCADVCDGQILYFYQNIGAPGVPYIVTMQDSDGNTLYIQTFTTEVATIPFTNLCPGNYTINVQGTSCSNMTMAYVSSPSPINLYANTTDPTFGNSNGEIEVVANGGTPGYTYSIDGTNYGTNNVFTGLAAGNYSVYLVDANGCDDTISVTLTDNTACNLVVTANPLSMVTCYGGCNGSLQYYYFDGLNNSPYLIELTQGGVTLQVQTNANSNGSGTFTNLCAGSYTVEVTDAQGCTGSYPITIIQPSPVTIGGVTTTNATAGNSDGTASIAATGGWPVLIYSLDGITYQASNTFTGLAAGVYIAYVKDNAGCVSIFTFVIQSDPGCNFNIFTTANNASCGWTCDGVITYTFAGTATDPPFTILLEDSNGNSVQSVTSINQTVNGNFTNLCPGDYTVTVTNAAGCAQTSNVSVLQPAPIYASPYWTNPTFGNSDGMISVSVTGGTAPYQYSIDNQSTWQASNTFSGLDAGAYIIYVQDANGCSTIVCVVLTESTGCNFFLNTNATDNSCAYSCDGEVSWNFNDPGNNPPYAIELIQGVNTVQTDSVLVGNGGFGSFTNLCEGVYVVEITDGNGCTQVDTVYVDAPANLYVSGVVVDDASAGNSDGSALVTVVGGTAPYQFSFDNGVTWDGSNPITGLAAGFYIMWVQDANGCQTIFCFIVNEDPGCAINTTLFLQNPVSCYGVCDGALNYAYSDAGSNPPYTIELSNNGTLVATDTQTSTSHSGTFTGLCAGNYSIVVYNADGCASFVSNYVLNQPAAINITVDVTNASTGNNNGVAEIIATGGTGQLLYSLDGSNFQTSNVFDTLSAGVYVVYIIDQNGCTGIHTFMVDENANCNIVLTAFNTAGISCGGGCTAAIGFAFNDVNINPPYVVTLESTTGGIIDSENFATGNGGSGSFTDLCAGTYVVTVTDVNGCQSFYTVMVNGPSFMQIMPTWINATAGNNDGSIDLNITGGTAPYEYSLDNQATWQTGENIPNLGAGFYIIYVKDANGCMQIVCVVLDDSNVIGIVEISEEIKVYPNPTSGYVFVSSDNVRSVNVYSLGGQIIPAASVVATNGIAFDLSDVADGVYVLEIQEMNGQISRVKVNKF